MKEKYGYQDWFKEKFKTEKISVKDALKLSVADSLQNHLVPGSFVLYRSKCAELGSTLCLYSQR